ncbi:MAG: phage recombination protein Bet [Candidatus Aminicenantes bacterium]|nr:MAG: phage recombination protein Bet [Candidatus Aminicenantes bacterium]
MAKDIVEYKAKDGQLINLNVETVRKYLVRGNNQAATSQEIIFFMGICKSRGLNPFKNDCYLIKYGNDPAAIITSIDYFRARAKAQLDCIGWNNGIIVKHKETGTIRKTSGLLDKDNEILLGGWFEALPKEWKVPCRLEINLFGYIKKTKDGKVTQFWQEDKQPTMIAKVAESQGLRKCWPDEFQGIYSDAEIIQEEIEQPEKPKVNKATYQAKEPEIITQDFDATISNQTDRKQQKPIRQSEEAEEPEKSEPQTEADLLIISFAKLNKEPLQKFEETHRAEIQTWPQDARDAFNEKWETKMKVSYEIFLRRLDIINGKTDTAQTPKPGQGTVMCKIDGEAKTYAACENACPEPGLFHKQECLERFPE